MYTVREIKDILKAQRLSISKRRGQNFLVDPGLQQKIIQAANIQSSDHILEIGPGLGALTEDLARAAAYVWAVEKDAGLARTLRQSLSSYRNLEIISEDILKVNLAKLCPDKLKVVGNLPYYITSPIIGYLLEGQREKLKEIFITVQEEVARRMLTGPQSKDYSAFSVLVQYFTKPKRLLHIPKKAFYPQPRVNSAFLHLSMLEQPAVSVNNQQQFFKIARACFNQRRKTILNSLAHNLKTIEKHQIEEMLQQAGIDFRIRPENLSLVQFAKIERIFFQRGVKLE